MTDNTLPTAGEHIAQQHDGYKDLERFMDSAEVGLDVFKDSIFASSLRLALQCAMQFSSSQSFQSSWPHYEICRITNVKNTASLASVCKMQ